MLEFGSDDEDDLPAKKKPKTAVSKTSASKSITSKHSSSKPAVIAKATASKLGFEDPEMNNAIPKHLLGTLDFAEGKGRVFLLPTDNGNGLYEISMEQGAKGSATDFWSIIRARIKRTSVEFLQF